LHSKARPQHCIAIKKRLCCWLQINSTNFTPLTQKCFSQPVYSVHIHYTHNALTLAPYIYADTHTHHTCAPSTVRAWTLGETWSNLLITFSLMKFIAHSWTTSDNVQFPCVFLWYIVFLVNKLLEAPLTYG